MKQLYFLSLLLLSTNVLLSQTLNFDWAKSMGGIGYTTGIGVDLVTDNNANTYVVGTFVGDSVDFDPGTGQLFLKPSGVDLFIQKLDVNGDLLWVKSIEGPGDSYARALAIDENNNIYITGEHYGTNDYDPGPATFNLTSIAQSDYIIFKLDSNGNFNWAASMGNGSINRGTSIAVKDGSVYVTGQYANMVDFDPGPGVFNLGSIASGAFGAFIHKLDTSGNLIWVKGFGQGSLGSARGESIDISDQHDIYVTGYFQGSVDFDPSPLISRRSTPAVNTNIINSFTVKFDSLGNYNWVRQIGSNLQSNGMKVKVDDNNNPILLGHFSDTVNFSLGSSPTITLIAQGYDYYLLNLDQSGNRLWLRHFKNPNDSFFVYSMSTNGSNIYLGGTFEGNFDANPGSSTNTLTPIGWYDGFIINLDRGGIYQWAVQIGGANARIRPRSMALCADDLNKLSVTGGFKGNVDFNPGSGVSTLSTVTTGFSDVFVQRYSASIVGLEKKSKESSTLIYPNPSKGQFFLELESVEDYQLEIYDLNGRLVEEVIAIATNRIELNLNLSSGVYLMQVRNQKRSENIKLVIE